jgi:hypothetical protein
MTMMLTISSASLASRNMTGCAGNPVARPIYGASDSGHVIWGVKGLG